MRTPIPALVAVFLTIPALVHTQAQAQTKAQTKAQHLVETGGRIAAVTVFPDRAEVTRTIEVALAKGESAVAVGGLPASLIPDSVRVSGAGKLEIGSVEIRPVFAEQAVQAAERRLGREIEALRDKRRGLDDRITALKLQLEFIKALGREGPRNIKEEMERGKLAPETWTQAWAAIAGGATEALQGIQQAGREQREIDRQIQLKSRELAQIRTGRKATVTARINVETAAATKARLRLSYQLPGASWRPLYDARLDSETGAVALTQIGEVHQRTGEDWSGVQLTLSTARPAAGARMPAPGSWFIDFEREVVAQFSGDGAGRKRDFQARELMKSDELSDTVAAAPEPESRLERDEAKVKVAQAAAGEFASEYRIAGSAVVPADGAAHKFTIARHDMDGRLAVRVVPKTAPRAYLYAEVTYDGEDPLLPGPLSVFRDGAFIGKSRLARLRPEETRKISFGIDDKVRVTYRLVDGERSRQGLINKDRRLERRYRTEVENHHVRPIEVTVLDQLPVPRDEQIDVDLLQDTTPPTAKAFEEHKGLFAWTETLQPNQKKLVVFAYAVSYPEDRQVAGF